MDKLEKIMWALAAVAILAVVAFAATGPLKSEISDKAIQIQWDERNDPGLFARERARRHVPPPGPVARASRTEEPAPAVPRAQAERRGDPPGERRAPAPQPPTTPPMTVALTPVYVPEAMAQKYQHFEDLLEIGQTAAGEDFALPDGSSGYRLLNVQQDSPLATRLGFQSGDVVISINGLPVQRESAQQLYAALKSERAFTVVFVRDGETLSRTFRIGER
jgi:hypothetical protein